MKKYKVVVTIPAIIEVTAETACDANEIVKKILAGHEETKNADVIQSAVHKAIRDGRENTYVQTLHIRK
jgi:hypothetical protein